MITILNMIWWTFCAHVKLQNTSSTWKKKEKKCGWTWTLSCSSIWIPCRSSAKGWESETRWLRPPSAWTSGSEATSFASALGHACGRCQPVANLTKQLSVKVDIIFLPNTHTWFPHESTGTGTGLQINTCDWRVSVLPTKSSIFSPRSNICPKVQHSQYGANCKH